MSQPMTEETSIKSNNVFPPRIINAFANRLITPLRQGTRNWVRRWLLMWHRAFATNLLTPQALLAQPAPDRGNVPNVVVCLTAGVLATTA